MHKIFLTVLAMVAVLAISGCQSVLNEPGGGNTQASSAPAQAPVTQPVGSYQEFDDVLIPNEMKLDDKASFVFETPQFKTGIVTYEGRVDAVSLANFFEKELPKDNWRLRSKMKYNRTIMVFEKADRDCIINIVDASFSTTVLEIMVAPRMDAGVQPQAAPQPAQASPMDENLPQ